MMTKKYVPPTTAPSSDTIQEDLRLALQREKDGDDEKCRRRKKTRVKEQSVHLCRRIGERSRKRWESIAPLSTVFHALSSSPLHF